MRRSAPAASPRSRRARTRVPATALVGASLDRLACGAIRIDPDSGTMRVRGDGCHDQWWWVKSQAAGMPFLRPRRARQEACKGRWRTAPRPAFPPTCASRRPLGGNHRRPASQGLAGGRSSFEPVLRNVETGTPPNPRRESDCSGATASMEKP